jgi:ribosome biogenesis GTPase A
MPSFISEKLASKYHLLSEDHYDFIHAERQLLGDLHRVLQKLDGSKEDLDLVHDLRTRIDDLFMVVVVGEFNAGKSTFINSLLGDKYLKSGVLPTTDRICLLRSDMEGSSEMKGDFVREAGSADSLTWKRSDHLMLEDVEELVVKGADWLQPGVALVDTPGTNALMSRHEYLSKVIVPRADLILFVTSAERPMSESECAFLSRIADWGKKVVICLNKKDIVSESEIKDVEEYVKLSAASRLQYTSGKVPVFSVSSARALEAKLASKGGSGSESAPSKDAVQRLYESSGIEAFETYLASTLGREEVLFNKLGAPLTVTDRLVAKSMEGLLSREDALLSDRRTLDMVAESMEGYERDLRRDTDYLREKAGAVFTEAKLRMRDYIAYSVTLPSVGRAVAASLSGPAEGAADGTRSPAAETEFANAIEQRARVELEQPLMEAVKDVADLMTQRSKSQASSVVQYVDASNVSREVGGRGGRVTEVSSGQWEAARMELVARLERQSRSVLQEGGVSDADIRWAWRQARGAFLGSQALGLASIGGFLSAALVPELIPGGPIPGFAVATLGGLLATTGPLFAYSRRGIESRLRQRIEMSREAMDSALQKAFEHELRTSKELIRSSISPYERYVLHETENVRRLQEELNFVRERARDMQRDLEGGSDAH